MTMEITDYLALAKRRWLLLVGVPLLAGVLAAVVLLTAPTKYTASATVNAPALVGGSSGQYTGSQAVSQFVAAFESTASSAPVDSAVTAKTKLSADETQAGLTVSQVGGSSAVTVTFVGTVKGQAPTVVSTVAGATLAHLFDSQVTLAQSRADDAVKQVSSANTAITAWGAKNGMVDPNKVYQAQLERLNSLQQSQVTFKAQGNAAAASALTGTIAEVDRTLKDFGPKIAAYSNLVAGRDSAASDLTSARQSLAQAKTQQTAADPAQVVWVGDEREVSRTDELVSIGLPVVGAGVFLALALIALLEVRRSNRALRRRSAGQPETTEARTGDADGKAAVRPAPRERMGESDPADSRVGGDGALVGTERS